MNTDGCWATVICNASERAAVGYTGPEWTLQCRLSARHDGNHATDGDTGAPAVRRRWLEWTDFSEYPHSLLERDPCPVPGRAGGACQFYVGHGGFHFYAPAPAGRQPANPRAQQQDSPIPSGSSGPTQAPTSHVRKPTDVSPSADSLRTVGSLGSARPPVAPARPAAARASMPPAGPNRVVPQSNSGPVPVAASVANRASLNGSDYYGGHRMADPAPAPEYPGVERNGIEHAGVERNTVEQNGVEREWGETLARIDATISESVDYSAEPRRSVQPEATSISDAIHDVAQALERLAKAYRSTGA